MKTMQISPETFLATFSPTKIFWRDQNNDGTVLTMLAATLIGGTPVVWETVKAASSAMTALIATLNTGNKYAAFDDGTGGTQEHEGILAALLSLTS